MIPMRMLIFKIKNSNLCSFVLFSNRITQSRSFQMLEGWISDSEKTVAALVPQAPLSNNSAGENLTFRKGFILIE